MQHGSLSRAIPDSLPEELTTLLAQGPCVRIERIVSRGHVSPPGFWYDQPEREYVLVVSGLARLEIEGHGEIELSPHAPWRHDGLAVFEGASVTVGQFKLGWLKTPAFANNTCESPVHSERCTPGSEGALGNRRGASLARRRAPTLQYHVGLSAKPSAQVPEFVYGHGHAYDPDPEYGDTP